MSIQKILVGYDGTAESENALEFAIDLSTQHEAKIHLAYVVHVPEGIANPIPDEVYESLLNVGRGTLSNAVRKVRNQFLSPFVHLKAGHPGDKLLKLAEEIKPDLVILGITKHSASEKTLGTVSAQFLSSMKYPLLLVP